MTPRDLLERIRKDREALAALWCGLTKEQMIRRPGPQEDWSVKDLIAHITWWESFILERVTDLINGAKSEPAEPQDVLNARVYKQHKDTPLTEVLAAFDANWPKLEAFISSLDDEQLNTPAYLLEPMTFRVHAAERLTPSLGRLSPKDEMHMNHDEHRSRQTIKRTLGICVQTRPSCMIPTEFWRSRCLWLMNLKLPRTQSGFNLATQHS